MVILNTMIIAAEERKGPRQDSLHREAAGPSGEWRNAATHAMASHQGRRAAGSQGRSAEGGWRSAHLRPAEFGLPASNGWLLRRGLPAPPTI